MYICRLDGTGPAADKLLWFFLRPVYLHHRRQADILRYFHDHKDGGVYAE